MQNGNTRNAAKPQAVRAVLIGDQTATAHAAGLTCCSSSPVFGLCRLLLKAGYSPTRPLVAYRAGTIALRVRSLHQGAALEVNSAGTDFAGFRGLRAGPPIAPNGNFDPEPSDGGGS
jgi:hypothetical protein